MSNKCWLLFQDEINTLLVFAPSGGVGDIIDATIGLSLTTTVVGVRASMAEREQRASELGATILPDERENKRQ